MEGQDRGNLEVQHWALEDGQRVESPEWVVGQEQDKLEAKDQVVLDGLDPTTKVGNLEVADGLGQPNLEVKVVGQERDNQVVDDLEDGKK